LNSFIKDSPFEDIYLKGMDVNIHLLAKGDKKGIPLILLPGITSYSYSFAHLMKQIPDEYYCISMDVRGRGTSSWPDQGYKLKNYVDDLLLVINYLVSNPIAPILVGHSMGARIAAAFASEYPKLVSGLVLIDPPINGPGQREVYPNPLEEMFLKQKQAVEEGQIGLFRSYLPPEFTEEQVQQRAEEYRNVSEAAIIESYESLLKEPFHAHLKNVSNPVCLLAAEFGDTIREQELSLIQRMNQVIETQRIKGVGHMIYKEDPAAVVSATIAFINKHIAPITS
jgi:N-formylmaleamate deformylase